MHSIPKGFIELHKNWLIILASMRWADLLRSQYREENQGREQDEVVDSGLSSESRRTGTWT